MFKKSIVEIAREDRKVFIWMGANFLMGLGLFLIGVFTLNPNSAVIKISYGDIGGYVDGGWSDMLVFPILAILTGVVHNLIALIVYKKYGGAICRIFLALSMFVCAGGIILIFRLMSEV